MFGLFCVSVAVSISSVFVVVSSVLSLCSSFIGRVYHNAYRNFIGSRFSCSGRSKTKETIWWCGYGESDPDLMLGKHT